MRKVDIISPIFNEEDVVEEFLNRISLVIRNSNLALNWDLEIVLVDDGSTDNTTEIAMRAAKALGLRLRIIKLSRNFGHQVAIMSGVKHTRDGSCIIAMDADLQDPPEIIESLLSGLVENQVVVTKRVSRVDSWHKKATSWAFYRLMGIVSDRKVALDSGDFWALAEQPSKIVRVGFNEKSVFTRAMVRDLGFRMIEVPFARDSRFAGKGKFTLSKMLALATSALVYYSSSPIKLAVFLGSTALVFGFLGLAFIVVGKVSGFINFTPGLVIFGAVAVPVVIIILFIQIISLILLGKTLDEVRNRPPYIVESIENTNEK